MKQIRATIVADVGLDSRANGIAAYLRVFLQYAKSVTCSTWAPHGCEETEHRLAATGRTGKCWRWLRKCLPRRIQDLHTLWRARNAIAQDCDVLFIQESDYVLPFLIGGGWPPIVLVMHGWNPPVVAKVRGYKNYLWLRMADFLAVRKAARVIMVSDEGLLGFAARYPRQRHKFIHVPTFLDDTFVPPVPVEVARHAAKSTTGPVLLCVSRLVPEKQVDRAIEVYGIVRKECPGARLNIIGDGPERPRLESMARLLGVEPGIHFEGTVPHEDMGRWLSGGDFFLLLSKWEGTSIALLEALAHGLYVVVTDIADHALLVNRETHGLVIRTACQTKEAASWIIRRHRAESEAGIVPRRLDATYLASRQVPRICDVLRQACEHIQDDEHER